MKLFLYGDFQDSFTKYSKKFVKEAGGKDAVIAVLMQGTEGSEKYFKQYSNVLKEHDAKDIFAVTPAEGSTNISSSDQEKISQATGILVCGGNMFRYKTIYCQQEVAELLKQKVNEGIPYAGISAGAILTSQLGFLKDFSIKPHFSELKRFEELIKKMKKNRSKYGLGIDGGIRIEIEDEITWKIAGSGALYLFSQKEEMFCFKTFHDGDFFELQI